MRIGCVSKQIIEYLAASAILVFSLTDVRAQTPEPAKTDTYLPAYVRPPPRETPAMTADERVKLEKELTAARDRQAAAVKARDKSGH
jgi:hypothetical protein